MPLSYGVKSSGCPVLPIHASRHNSANLARRDIKWPSDDGGTFLSHYFCWEEVLADDLRTCRAFIRLNGSWCRSHGLNTPACERTMKNGASREPAEQPAPSI